MISEETNKLLEEWWLALTDAVAAKAVIEKELELRKEVFNQCFPTPVEGTNTLELPNGWKLKGIYKLDRKVDVAALPAVSETLREMNVNAERLVRYKPELETKAYKELTDEQRHVFDQALTTKPGSPSLEFSAPKEKK